MDIFSLSIETLKSTCIFYISGSLSSLKVIQMINYACVFFPYPCFVFALVHTNLKNFGIKTYFQFYAAQVVFQIFLKLM